MLFGRLTRDPEWLGEVAGVDARHDRRPCDPLRGARRAGSSCSRGWVLVMTNFERQLYADPDADLDTLWWDLVERYQHVRRPDSRHAPDWASKIHLAAAPVYYQNYLYGELFASQLDATLADRAGGIVDRRAAGALLDATSSRRVRRCGGTSSRPRHRRAAQRRDLAASCDPEIDG